MRSHEPSPPTSDVEAAVLSALRARHPDPESVAVEVARLRAELTLPKPAIHVLSDVHGEDVKLRHVINNASGTLRPLVEGLFSRRRSAAEVQSLLTLIFYPHETLKRGERILNDPASTRRHLEDMFEILRELAGRRTFEKVQGVFPAPFRDLCSELLYGRAARNEAGFVDAVLGAFEQQGQTERLLRIVARAVRNLTVDEIVVAGDCWDRGPRGDRVLDYLSRQPNVSFAWGNHDIAWLGAALGHDALIAYVLRVSLRYRRLSQLEEGYGITLQPLERLVRDVYADDPAEHYRPRGSGLREPLTVARAQKAIAVMQFKLEGQLIMRNPSFQLDHRRLLHHLDLAAKTVTIDGIPRALKDTYFPTLDPRDPYRLSEEEQRCLDRTRRSFLTSDKMWDHARFLVDRGRMYLVRDDHLIFHGCVPVDENGRFLEFPIDGAPHRGRALFEAFERVVARAVRSPSPPDLDLIWYLWCGPRSPLFGKDRIATFERDLVAEKEAHREHKNPYFTLIHEEKFCEDVLRELGADPGRGLIVNGHVPVKLEKGEEPLKKSGKAVTIDGAFSEAYGDHGFTLVLDADRTFLAKHHHFESVEAAVEQGIDIIPEVTELRRWNPPRRLADTERGREIRGAIALLEKLAAHARWTSEPAGDQSVKQGE